MILKTPGNFLVMMVLKFLALVFVLLGISACTIEPTKTVPEEYKLGQSHFHRVCAPCHGRDAMGGNNAPTFLQEKFHPKHFPNGKIARTILNGSTSGAMPSQKGKVNDKQIREIIKFIRHSQKEAGVIS